MAEKPESVPASLLLSLAFVALSPLALGWNLDLFWIRMDGLSYRRLNEIVDDFTLPALVLPLLFAVTYALAVGEPPSRCRRRSFALLALGTLICVGLALAPVPADDSNLAWLAG